VHPSSLFVHLEVPGHGGLEVRPVCARIAIRTLIRVEIKAATRQNSDRIRYHDKLYDRADVIERILMELAIELVVELMD
jgi:hypothetical protein